MRSLPLSFLFLLVLLSAAHAGTLRVPEDYSRIQSALNAAAAGDTVLVSDGTYIERLLWPSTPSIHLLSRSGAAVTIINGGARESCCGIYTGVDTTTVLRGFTFTNGQVAGG